MAKKKFMLRIDEATMKAVEAWAAEEFRSVNGQLEWIITKALREAGRLPGPEQQSPVRKKTEKQKNDSAESD